MVDCKERRVYWIASAFVFEEEVDMVGSSFDCSLTEAGRADKVHLPFISISGNDKR
jgi:hypothetical protein